MKYFLGFLLFGIALFVTLGLLGPKNLNTTSSTVVDAPPSIIFNLVNDIKEAQNWNAWAIEDTTMITTYPTQNTMGKGGTARWVSQHHGSGTHTIVESIPNKQVKSVFAFDGWEGANKAQFDINPEGNQTRVSWIYEGTILPFYLRPVALIGGITEEMQSQFDRSLENLKKMSEQRAKGIYHGQQIVETELPEKHFVMHRQKVDTRNIQQFYATYLGKLFVDVQSAGAEMQGMPCGLYFKFAEGNNTEADMAAAIPVKEPVTIAGVNLYTIPSQDALTLDFYGDYKSTTEGHEAIEAYMKDRGYLQNPPIIEEYVTDPTKEKDPDKWLTKMTYYYTVSQ